MASPSRGIPAGPSAPLPFPEALARLRAALPPPVAEIVPSDAAAGRVVAAEVRSAVEMPPFDRAAMDGFALRCADLASAPAPAQLPVAGESAAGRPFPGPLPPRAAVRIMTGAPVPPGADAVVMVEHTEPAGRSVRILRAPAPGANIVPRASEIAPGDLLIPLGRRLRPQDVGLLAMAGAGSVAVFRRPSVAVLATGDELVPPGTEPGPGQIRNSNAPMLAAQVRALGFACDVLGPARDTPASLGPLVEEGLRRDVLIVSGGISTGAYDLVAGALREAGVEILFEKVAVRPGKPFLFGRAGGRRVFGLPGNPVSGFVIFEVFVREALAAMSGDPALVRPRVRARLAREFVRPPRSLLEFVPCLLERGPDGLRAEPVTWAGSGDLLGLTRGNALLIVPPEVPGLPAGAEVEALRVGECGR